MLFRKFVCIESTHRLGKSIHMSTSDIARQNYYTFAQDTTTATYVRSAVSGRNKKEATTPRPYEKEFLLEDGRTCTYRYVRTSYNTRVLE